MREGERDGVKSRGERGWQTMTDVAGGKGRRIWERRSLRDGALNPLPHRSPPPPPPVDFAMVTRQGSRCSRLMCFSAAGTSWVLMCLGLSPEQSMSTVLGHTNTRRAASQGTLSHTGWMSGREPDRKPYYVPSIHQRTFICLLCPSQILHVDLNNRYLSHLTKVSRGGKYVTRSTFVL